MGMGFILAGFAVSQVFEGAGGAAVAALKAAFDDPGARLPRALEQANERAWQVLELALQDRSGLLTRLNNLPARLTRKENRVLADALSGFLAGRPLALPDQATAGQALKQLRQARERGLLDLDLDQRLLDEAGGLQRYSDPSGLLAGAHHTVDALGGELERAGFVALAGVLAAQPSQSPPLLVTAFAWFFQRQVESDPELARGLQFKQLQQLGAAQAAGFAGLEQAMSAFGGDLRHIVDELAGVQQGLAQVHAVVLDIHREQRQAGDAQRGLYQRLEQLLQRTDANQALVSPRLSYSLHGEHERHLVKQLIDEYRGLPEAQRQRLPALLDGIGKLQMGLGDAESLQAAERSFDRLAHSASAPRARAQGAYNAYRAALERRDWAGARTHLDRAMALDPGLAPFPVEKYELQAILGAGGFGVALQCLDRFTGGQRVIKALHPDDLSRPLSEVFAEVAALGELCDPALIRIHGAHYVDWTSKAWPYIEMEWFDAPSLEIWLRDHGSLSVEQAVALITPLVVAMRRVHAAGLLHRDLSPDNLLLRPDDQGGWDLRIIDFGLAYRLDAAAGRMGSGKSMLQQSLTGKWDYAPPEQRLGGRLGAYSDVYSFGRTICKALFGTPSPVGRRIWNSIPEGLADLLESCVQDLITDRPADFGVVAERLAAWRSVPTVTQQESGYSTDVVHDETQKSGAQTQVSRETGDLENIIQQIKKSRSQTAKGKNLNSISSNVSSGFKAKTKGHDYKAYYNIDLRREVASWGAKYGVPVELIVKLVVAMKDESEQSKQNIINICNDWN